MKYIDHYGIMFAFGQAFIRVDDPCESCVHKKEEEENEDDKARSSK